MAIPFFPNPIPIRPLVRGGMAALTAAFVWLISGTAVAAEGSSCPKDQRALVELDARMPQSAAISAADLRGQVRVALEESGLMSLEPDIASAALEARQKQLIAMGDVVGALNLAREIEATVRVKAQIQGSQRQIKGLAKGLYNVSVQIQLEAFSTQTGGKMASVHESHQKPGLGLDAQLRDLMDALLPGMAQRLVAELCGNASAPASPPMGQDTQDETPAVGTGAAQLDSL